MTSDPSELATLHELCRSAQLYEVERWIRADRPLQLSRGAVGVRRRQRSALEIAIERQDQALVFLLLANGYDLTLEVSEPLAAVLSMRRRDLLDLLLAWGADPQRVCLDALFATYNSELFERFRSLGVDLAAGAAMADALGYHTSNKPLFGFAKRHRLTKPRVQRSLDIALAHHTGTGSEKGVMLCLWAGANPHARVPSLCDAALSPEDLDWDEGSTAIEAACWGGCSRILELLKPDPIQDDFEALYRSAANEKVVEILAQLALPRDPGAAIASQISSTRWTFPERRPVRALVALFAAGVRWQEGSSAAIAMVRRDLLECADWRFVEIMVLLATADHCSETVLTELARTSAMRARMKRTQLIPLSPHDRSAFDRMRPTRAWEMLARLGIQRPKPHRPKRALRDPRPASRASPPQTPVRTVERIGPRRAHGVQLRLSWLELFERVWAQPVETLAKEWGLSGRGLAKACRRLGIAVPPRGYWARVAAGQKPRRPRPRERADGLDLQIVIIVRPPGERASPESLS